MDLLRATTLAIKYFYHQGFVRWDVATIDANVIVFGFKKHVDHKKV